MLDVSTKILYLFFQRPSTPLPVHPTEKECIAMYTLELAREADVVFRLKRGTLVTA